MYVLHGCVHRNYCMKCRKFFDGRYVRDAAGIPRCDKCHGIVKPDVVLYEEGLDMEVMQGAAEAIAGAEILIVGGTSLVVYPAAGLLRYFNGRALVVINKSATPADRNADLLIQAPIGEILGQIEVK